MIECVPVASEVVENDATPDEFNVPDPMTADPSEKFTVPVGTPLPATGETCAENSIDWPAAAEAGVAVKVVVVAARLEELPEIFRNS